MTSPETVIYDVDLEHNKGSWCFSRNVELQKVSKRLRYDKTVDITVWVLEIALDYLSPDLFRVNVAHSLVKKLMRKLSSQISNLSPLWILENDQTIYSFGYKKALNIGFKLVIWL